MHGPTTGQGGWQGSHAGAPASGAITVVTGCMFSGKTTHLLHELAGQPPGTALAFKPLIDTRYRTDALVSHDGGTCRATGIDKATDVLDLAVGDGVRLIAIDEVHFLDETLVDVATKLSRRGIVLYLAGLDIDSWGRPFPHMVRLASVATHVVSRRGQCARCGAPATRTQRTRPFVDGQLVGGRESYEPRCEPCWTPPPVLSSAIHSR